MKPKNRYSSILEQIFALQYKPGTESFEFERELIESVATELSIRVPKNIGDLIYSFRYRTALPDSIASTAGAGKTWIIRPVGKARYQMALVPEQPLTPNLNLAVTKVPDATPGLLSLYAFNDEQALLTRLRYNRLVDIFTGITCYSLQNHLRTTIPSMGQVETDELYVGIDKKGCHYIVPVQAKAGSDKLSVVQIEQDFAVCAHKFPNLICRPVGAQFLTGGVIALFEFEQGVDRVLISGERHYLLVPSEDVTPELVRGYRERLFE
jgi:hypothetical protein